jgi:hypothetical protein
MFIPIQKYIIKMLMFVFDLSGLAALVCVCIFYVKNSHSIYRIVGEISFSLSSMLMGYIAGFNFLTCSKYINDYCSEKILSILIF